MGAILAIIGEKGDPELPVRLERMIARSPYRGQPQRHAEGGLALAIMTLGWDASLASWGNWLAAFHGYIGNWDELRSACSLDLPEESSNAERIVRAYDAIGDSLFAKLRGEFAVLIFDRQRQVAHVARDVVGWRPLFYEQAGGRTFIATELRQVLAGSGTQPKLDEDALVDQLLFHEGTPASTLCVSVKRFRAGAATSLSRGATPTDRREYWMPPEEERPLEDIPHEELAAELRVLLLQALRRTLPDRPSAVSLSGGIDSSAIWGLVSLLARDGDARAERCVPISLVFPGLACDERALVEVTCAATGAKGTIIECPDSVVADFDEHDVASVDAVFVPTMFGTDLVCGHAVSSGHPVVVLGIGGDEWLRGSPNYLIDLLRSGRWLAFLNDIWRLPDGGPRARYRLIRSVVLPALLKSGFHRSGLADRPAWLSKTRWERVAGLNTECWRNTLSHLPEGRRSSYGVLPAYRSGRGVEQAEQGAASWGAELRNPLCDADVMSFGYRTPSRSLTGRGQRTKHLLRLAAGDVLPPAVRDRTQKVAFSSVFPKAVQELTPLADPAAWALVQRGVVERSELDNLARSVRLTSNGYQSFVLWKLWVAERVVRRFG